MPGNKPLSVAQLLSCHFWLWILEDAARGWQDAAMDWQDAARGWQQKGKRAGPAGPKNSFASC
jgi:hypothetical protein